MGRDEVAFVTFQTHKLALVFFSNPTKITWIEAQPSKPRSTQRVIVYIQVRDFSFQKGFIFTTIWHYAILEASERAVSRICCAASRPGRPTRVASSVAKPRSA
jgi:hypothetical protein